MNAAAGGSVSLSPHDAGAVWMRVVDTPARAGGAVLLAGLSRAEGASTTSAAPLRRDMWASRIGPVA